MTTWTTTKLPLAIPAEHRGLGNKAADLFDPNTEGNRTFPEPNAYIDGSDTTPTHCLVRTQLVTEFVPLLSPALRTPEIWEPLLLQMSVERGKPSISKSEIEMLCNVLLFNDECNNLIYSTR